MFAIIADDLEIIAEKVEKAFRLKAGPVSSFLPEMALAPLDRNLRPALLLLSARLGVGEQPSVLAMGTVVQYIFFAQVIHNRIPDGGAKELPQFPVLIGDYLYSKYFQTLSENGLLVWLAPLAGTICRMNEGGIRRYQVLDHGQPTPEDYQQTAEEEEGLLLAQACRIGALLGGRADLADALADYGRSLGTAWGIVKGGYPADAAAHLAAARAALAGIPGGGEKDAFLAVLDRVGEASWLK